MRFTLVVLAEEGRLYQWGLDNEVVIRGPTLVRDLSREKVLSLSCGRKHTIVLTGSYDNIESFRGSEVILFEN